MDATHPCHCFHCTRSGCICRALCKPNGERRFALPLPFGNVCLAAALAPMGSVLTQFVSKRKRRRPALSRGGDLAIASGEVKTRELIHPKVEPEICFVL